VRTDDARPKDATGSRDWPAPEWLKPIKRFRSGAVIVSAGTGVRELYLIAQGVAGRFVHNRDGDILDAVRGPRLAM
jgi:hypothetical protein